MRFLPHTAEDRAEMLSSIGVDSVDALYSSVPAEARLNAPLPLPSALSEMEIEQELSALANKNRAASQGPFFLGAGCYYHHIPATVDALIQRGEYLTSYTPYQPEISQGTLTAVFEFQSMIAALTGMEVANASMYDGATSVTEAALMAQRVSRKEKVVVHGALHPHYAEVLDTAMSFRESPVVYDGTVDGETACVIAQTPDFHGSPQALDALRAQCDEHGALLVVAIAEIVSLGLLPAPAQADIVAGEAQSIGVPMSFGGPHLGFFATKQKYLRQMPGRLCGETVDEDGKRSFVLTLNTREQHIRREKATSNICTNQGLMALAFTIHLSLLGETGFHRLARLNHARACRLADALSAVPGVSVENDAYFNEFVVTLPRPSAEVVKALAGKGVVAGLALDGNRLLVTATEMTREADIDVYASALREVLA